MRCYNEENASRLVDAEIAARQKVLSLYGEVIRTVQSFDGKVLNKRLETALKKVDKNLFVNFSSYSFYISYGTRDFATVGTEGYYIYLEDGSIRMCYCNNVSNEEGRIRADVIVTALYKYMESMENTVDAIQAKKNLIPEYKQRLSDISGSLKELQDEIPSVIKHYYGLDAHIRNN